MTRTAERSKVSVLPSWHKSADQTCLGLLLWSLATQAARARAHVFHYQYCYYKCYSSRYTTTVGVTVANISVTATCITNMTVVAIVPVVMVAFTTASIITVIIL